MKDELKNLKTDISFMHKNLKKHTIPDEHQIVTTIYLFKS